MVLLREYLTPKTKGARASALSLHISAFFRKLGLSGGDKILFFPRTRGLCKTCLLIVILEVSLRCPRKREGNSPVFSPEECISREYVRVVKHVTGTSTVLQDDNVREQHQAKAQLLLGHLHALHLPCMRRHV